MNMISSIISPVSSIWQSRRLWFVLLAFSLAATLLAFKIMFTALPALKANITFTREQAIDASALLQQKIFPELKTNQFAVSFAIDRDLQTYVELEGGGVDAFQHQINNPDVAAYAWNVRRFAGSQESELWVSFTPSGEPLKYSLKVPEKDPGAALDADAARVIAETGVRAFWGERFNAYKIFDSKLFRQTSGRVDHVFTYENESLKLGEATSRVELTVAGDKLISINPSNHIPDAFNQRFNEMRATNNQIQQIANFLMLGLFGLCGLVGGGLWLHKRHQLQWRKGFIPASIVASGMAAAILCNLPTAWMSYNTTTTTNTFLMQQFIGYGVVLIGATLIFCTIYAVAEGLTRLAFAEQPRLFDFFRQPVASTEDAYGRVLGGYIWAGFFLLYSMLFILLSRNVFGWWMPADLEVDPNILASWRPALGPIFMALQAGTWEECVFRAIPLAAASLIGTRFGIRKPLVIFVLIAQAIIFGGAHASYPNLPGYSRLVELFIPAIFFGLVYLRFGLVSGILAHFVFDLVLMSLPIFVSTDSHLIIDKAIVIAAGATPLLILLWARYRTGRLTTLADEWRNGNVVAEVNDPKNDVEFQPVVASQSGPLVGFSLNTKWLLSIAIFSVVILFSAWNKTPEVDWPHFKVNRDEALVLAKAELNKRGVKLEGEWRSTVLTGDGWQEPREFVWQESGKEKFQSLLGHFLSTAQWEVTWRKFDGPVEQRTEKWLVLLRPDGSLLDVEHELPEQTAGARLTREQAITKAKSWIFASQWAIESDLEEGSIGETVRPNRSDWSLVFFDEAAFNQNDTHAFIKITLNGDEITGARRGIDVPEQWQRIKDEKQAQKSPFTFATSFALALLIGLVISTFFRKYQGGVFNLRATLPWVFIIVTARMVDALLWMDTSSLYFQTTMNWSNQLWTTLAEKSLHAAAFAVLSILMLQAVYAERPISGSNPKGDFILGAGLASLFAALNAFISLTFPSHETPAIITADLASYVPWLSTTINALKDIDYVIAAIVLAIGILRFSQTRIRFTLLAVLALVWSICSGFAAKEIGLEIAHNVIILLAMAIIVFLVNRKQVGVAIGMAGVYLALQRADIAYALYASAWLHAVIATIITAAITYALVWHWHRNAR